MIERPTLPDGRALEVTRLCRGLSQGVVAARAGIGFGRYRSIEMGTAKPSTLEVMKILGVLSCAHDYEEEPAP